MMISSRRSPAVPPGEAVSKMVLMNPQGFIDGAPKVGPLGALGIKVCLGCGSASGARDPGGCLYLSKLMINGWFDGWFYG